MLDNNFWKKYFKIYDILNRATPYQDLLSAILGALKAKRGQTIFDAGSGTGNLSLLVKKSGAEVIGLDYSLAGIELHRSKDQQAKVIHGDLTRKLPFKDDYFDGIVSNNVIYTLDKHLRSRIFSEFHRVTKKGGVIVVSNIRQGFSPARIFRQHLADALKNQGLVRTLGELIVLGPGLIKMFYYNYLIKKENKGRKFSFMTEDEQAGLLKASGFEVVSRNNLVYADQAYLDVGIKKV
ncbi:MAG: methyltransferase domain-containing protein [Patescibacteria group bacterium]